MYMRMNENGFGRRTTAVAAPLAIALACGLATGASAQQATEKQKQAERQAEQRDGAMKVRLGTAQQTGGREMTVYETSDVMIGDVIEDELLFDHAVNSLGIEATVQQGIATLTGEVSSLLERDRAARIAETVRGVRAVVNLIEVEPVVDRSDSQITRDVNAAITQNPATEKYEVTAEAENGVVTLSGKVDSHQEKELAMKLAKGVIGVTGVTDQIDVIHAMDRPDSDIRNDVAEALAWNTLVDDRFIDVKVDGGKVTLAGTVGSAAEKREAMLTAWVNGVSDVAAEALTVEPWARSEHRKEKAFTPKSDQRIRAAVEDALLYDPRVSSFAVTTEVDKGEVTLRGAVNSLEAKRAAASDARLTEGVLKVNNRLRVRSEAETTDEAIEEDLRAALRRDPHVERFEIRVDVSDGVARLYGNVDSNFEMVRADAVAARTDGVVEVKNHLSISDTHSPYIYEPYLDDLYSDTFIAAYVPPRTMKPDAEIREEINDELFWSPFVDSDDVDVTVENSVATLTGSVDDVSEWYSAQENAFEGGATWVVNNLEIR